MPVTKVTDKLPDDASLPEDRRLVNWKRWLADRRKQSRHIELVTGRPQVDQLQSSSDRYRAVVETKELMENAAIPTPVIPDKYRGGPEFWRTPELLADRGDPSLPEVSLTLTRRQLNLPPELTRVGLPDLTAKERDLVAPETKKEPWRRNEYLRTRKLELAQEIALLLPKEPETAALAVKGQTFRGRKPQASILCERRQLRIPVISVSEPDEKESYEDIDQTVVLKIQDREFVWRGSSVGAEATDAEDITWSLTFESKINERVEKEIVLENRGTRVIPYYWRDAFLLPGASIRKLGGLFFFNKTKGLILPGQIVRIKVWYRSRTRGVSTERWRLVTEPKLSPSAFVFRFWGCAFDVRDAESTGDRAIDVYLDRCVRDSVVRAVIEEIMSGVEHSKPPEPLYKTLFLESDLFSSLNPCYFYHPSVVTQLRELYRDVTDESTPPWSLSLDTLRDILLQIVEINRRRDKLARFYELCKRCLRPTLYDITRDTKSDAVYDVLGAFANLFEAESEFVKNNSLIRKKQPTVTARVNHDSQRSISSVQESSNNLEETRSAKSVDQSQRTQAQNEQETLVLNLRLYEEVFFIRMYKALEEAIERACAIIDSLDSTNRKK